MLILIEIGPAVIEIRGIGNGELAVAGYSNYDQVTLVIVHGFPPKSENKNASYFTQPKYFESSNNLCPSLVLCLCQFAVKFKFSSHEKVMMYATSG